MGNPYDGVASLFGATGGAATASYGVSLATLKSAQATGAEQKGIDRVAKQAEVKQAVAAFTKAVEGGKDLDKVLRDPRVLKVLLPALGLAGDVDKPGLAARALQADPAAKGGLLANLKSSWKTAAETLGLHGGGLKALQDPALREKLVQGYLKYEWRESLDDKAPGVANAMYFKENVGKAKTVYDILGDSVLRQVMTTALGLPEQIAIQSVETQGRAVTSRLRLAELDDPKKVQKLIDRYLISKADSANAAAGAGSPDLITLALSLKA